MPETDCAGEAAANLSKAARSEVHNDEEGVTLSIAVNPRQAAQAPKPTEPNLPTKRSSTNPTQTISSRWHGKGSWGRTEYESTITRTNQNVHPDRVASERVVGKGRMRDENEWNNGKKKRRGVSHGIVAIATAVGKMKWAGGLAGWGGWGGWAGQAG